MKWFTYTLCILVFCTSTAFSLSEACEYAGSNIGYIKTQTQKAIDSKDYNISRFYAYKALNAIEKSRKQFKACGCEYALDHITESLDNLKKATRISTLSGARILLQRSLENTQGSLEAIESHELHGSKYASDVLALNTTEANAKKKAAKKLSTAMFQAKIDSSLIGFKRSLNKVMTTLDCKEAEAYATKVFQRCEQELLRPELSEGRKYYNLKTKAIASEALTNHKPCN